MAVYANLLITRKIKFQGSLPDDSDDIKETLGDQTSVEYPEEFDCEEIDGSVEATIDNRYAGLLITRRIKIQDPLPDDIIETLEDQTSVKYPEEFDCVEIDGSVEANYEDAD